MESFKGSHPWLFSSNWVWFFGFNPLKNISKWEGLSHILWKKMFETTNQGFSMLVMFHCTFQLAKFVFVFLQ